jgi:hypothetical protein
MHYMRTCREQIMSYSRKSIVRRISIPFDTYNNRLFLFRIRNSEERVKLSNEVQQNDIGSEYRMV